MFFIASFNIKSPIKKKRKRRHNIVSRNVSRVSNLLTDKIFFSKMKSLIKKERISIIIFTSSMITIFFFFWKLTITCNHYNLCHNLFSLGEYSMPNGWIPHCVIACKSHKETALGKSYAINSTQKTLKKNRYWIIDVDNHPPDYNNNLMFIYD